MSDTALPKVLYIHPRTEPHRRAGGQMPSLLSGGWSSERVTDDDVRYVRDDVVAESVNDALSDVWKVSRDFINAQSITLLYSHGLDDDRAPGNLIGALNAAIYNSNNQINVCRTMLGCARRDRDTALERADRAKGHVDKLLQAVDSVIKWQTRVAEELEKQSEVWADQLPSYSDALKFDAVQCRQCIRTLGQIVVSVENERGTD